MKRRGIERAKADLEGERTAIALDRQRYAERLGGHIPGLQQQLAHFKGIDWNRLSAENPTLLPRRSRCSIRSLANCSKPRPSGCSCSSRSVSASSMAVQAHQDHVAEQKQALIAKHPELADPVIVARRRPHSPGTWSTPAIDSRSCRAWSITATSSWRARRCCNDRLMANKDKVRRRWRRFPGYRKPGTARESAVAAPSGARHS